MKRSAFALIISMSVVGVLGCNNIETDESRKQREAQVEEHKTQQAITKLAEAHNAVVHWRQGLLSNDPFARVYTAELAPILIRPDGRPILFVADVLDVSPNAKNDECSFEADVNGSWKLRLTLVCSPEQANQIMKGPEGKYAVVARIISVGSAVPRPDEDDHEKVHAWFPAHGECLGLFNLGANYLDDLFEVLAVPGTTPAK